MSKLHFKADLKGLSKGLDAAHRKQLPYAAALAFTETAGHVGVAWQHEIEKTFDRPTPFTVNSVNVQGARKNRLVAVVHIKDIAAAYLEPFVDGGLHFLGNKLAMLTPKDIRTNAYGNLPRNKIASLKARPDVFIGPVTFKDGQTINGVWQRVGTHGARRDGSKGRRDVLYFKHNKAQGVTSRTTLKLLIRFDDPQPITQHLDLIGPANRAIAQYLGPSFAKAFNKAMAAAR